LYCIAFIHFYSASHSMSLSETCQIPAIDPMSKITRRSATGNCKWRTCVGDYTPKRYRQL